MAGTINGDGALKARVPATADATSLAQVIELVQRAQESKPQIQKLADRVVADQVPPTSGEAVAALQRLGLKVIMLTGDKATTARAVAKQVGVDEVMAEVRPDEMQAVIRRLQQQGEVVAMVGDGINDAAALTTADLGIAIGSGADVAIESADIVLVGRDRLAIPMALKLARQTRRTIVQNLGWAFVYNIALIPLATGVFIPLSGLRVPPSMAAAAMALSSISVVSNSLLLRTRRLK